jgi:lipid-A-disaccharide synthase
LSDPGVFISAGEPSGDLHGAELARELRKRLPGARLYGLGGSLMAAEGVNLLADLDRLAVLGFSEIIRHLPDLAALRREVRAFLRGRDIDLLVPIDYPGFNLPLARYASQLDIRVLYYIAPQVWAWHESRARNLARDTDVVCVVLPFEEERLRRWGVRTRFVGHPLLDRADPVEKAEVSIPHVALFPGSRRQEVRRLLPVFMEAARRLRDEVPHLEILVARARDLPPETFAALPDVRIVGAEEALSSSRAAITKSGTITLQLALAGVPMVVGYRVSPLTYAIARRLVSVDHIALVNLVAGERLVPELIQGEVKAGRIAASVLPLLEEGPERSRQIEGLRRVVDRLGSPGAAARVADECVRLLENREGSAVTG